MLIEQNSLIYEIETSRDVVQEAPGNCFTGLSISTIAFYAGLPEDKSYFECNNNFFCDLTRERSSKEIYRAYYRNISEAINKLALLSWPSERATTPKRAIVSISFFDHYHLKRSYTIIFNSDEDLKNMYDDLIYRAYELS